MSALYWQGFDCTPESRNIEHADTAHRHHANEYAACVEYVDLLWRSHCGSQGDCVRPSACEWHHGSRYWCVRGPGGLLRGVRL